MLVSQVVSSLKALWTVINTQGLSLLRLQKYPKILGILYNGIKLLKTSFDSEETAQTRDNDLIIKMTWKFFQGASIVYSGLSASLYEHNLTFRQQVSRLVWINRKHKGKVLRVVIWCDRNIGLLLPFNTADCPATDLRSLISAFPFLLALRI